MLACSVCGAYATPLSSAHASLVACVCTSTATPPPSPRPLSSGAAEDAALRARSPSCDLLRPATFPDAVDIDALRAAGVTEAAAVRALVACGGRQGDALVYLRAMASLTAAQHAFARRCTPPSIPSLLQIGASGASGVTVRASTVDREREAHALS